ncbi:MAG: hypothetical protein ACFE91_00615 [Promethearchaeota archaeon]
MKKSNLIKKLILLTLVGLMISGLSVGVQGTQNEKIRSLNEFGETNPWLGVWYIWPRLFFSYEWYGDFADPSVVYDGFILEKENSDGSLDVMVNLHIKYLTVGVLEIGKGVVFMGIGELYFYLKFTMDVGNYGIELPTIDALLEGISEENSLHLKDIHFIATASGYYFEPGMDAVPAILTFKGLGLVKPNIPEDHPLRLTLPVIWPGEFIEIHII